MNFFVAKRVVSTRFRVLVRIAAVGVVTAGLSSAPPAVASPHCGATIESWFHVNNGETRYTGRVVQLNAKSEPVGPLIDIVLSLREGNTFVDGAVVNNLVQAVFLGPHAPEIFRSPQAPRLGDWGGSPTISEQKSLSWNTPVFHSNYRMAPADCDKDHVATSTLRATVLGKQYGTLSGELLNSSPL